MSKLLLFTIVSSVLFFSSCKSNKDYKNKEAYSIKTNELCEIYYTTNSCCQYCVINESDLKHISLQEDKTVDDGPRGCDGCDFTNAFVFKGTSPGIDTVVLKHSTNGDECILSDTLKIEKYIVEVK